MDREDADLKHSQRRLQKDTRVTLVGLVCTADQFPVIDDQSSMTRVVLADQNILHDIDRTIRKTEVLRRSVRAPGPSFKIRVTGMLRHRKEANQYRFVLEDIYDVGIAVLRDETNKWYDVVRTD